MKHLQSLLEKIWDGDVQLAEVERHFTPVELAAMDKTVGDNPTIFKDGVPFKGDDEIFDLMLENDRGTTLIMQMIDIID